MSCKILFEHIWFVFVKLQCHRCRARFKDARLVLNLDVQCHWAPSWNNFLGALPCATCRTESDRDDSSPFSSSRPCTRPTPVDRSVQTCSIAWTTDICGSLSDFWRIYFRDAALDWTAAIESVLPLPQKRVVFFLWTSQCEGVFLNADLCVNNGRKYVTWADSETMGTIIGVQFRNCLLCNPRPMACNNTVVHGLVDGVIRVLPLRLSFWLTRSRVKMVRPSAELRFRLDLLPGCSPYSMKLAIDTAVTLTLNPTFMNLPWPLVVKIVSSKQSAIEHTWPDWVT